MSVSKTNYVLMVIKMKDLVLSDLHHVVISPPGPYTTEVLLLRNMDYLFAHQFWKLWCSSWQTCYLSISMVIIETSMVRRWTL